MEQLPKIVVFSEKIYRKLLRLYPRSHRRDYAEPMAQLFRDQCRDAWRGRRFIGVAKLWLRVLPDLGKTSVKEQIAAIERSQIMKYINAKSAPTILTAAGLALAFVSFIFSTSSDAWTISIVAAFVAILAKALVELFRPGNEYGRIFLRTFLIMFCFAIFMPAWAKATTGFVVVAGFNPHLNNPLDRFGCLMMISLLANPVVATIKFLQFLIQRRKS